MMLVLLQPGPGNTAETWRDRPAREGKDPLPPREFVARPKHKEREDLNVLQKVGFRETSHFASGA